MSTPKRQKVSAQRITADIKSGLSAAEIMDKYELSEKAFRIVCEKLLTGGHITSADLSRFSRQSSEEPSRHFRREPTWNCPACGVGQETEMSECPMCGIVVSKFNQLQSNPYQRTNALPIYETAPEDNSRWALVALSMAVFAVVGLGLLVWSMHKSKTKAMLPVIENARIQYSDSATSTDSKTSNEVASEGVVLNPPGDGTDANVSQIAPRAESTRVIPPHKYVTGELRQFTSDNFREEVSEASKTYPVLFQFYSDT